MVFHHRHHWIRRNEMEIGLEECRGNKRRTRNRDRISVLSGLIGVSFLFFVSLFLSLDGINVAFKQGALTRPRFRAREKYIMLIVGERKHW